MIMDNFERAVPPFYRLNGELGMRSSVCRRETMFSCGGKHLDVSVIVQTRFYIEVPPSKTPLSASFLPAFRRPPL